MSGYLDRLEEQLVAAASAGGSELPIRRRRAARRRSPRAIPAGAAAAIILVLLVASAVALAVTGTFSTGSPVSPPGHPAPSSGAGVPARGTHLLALRAADPASGLPWGMRLVRTTRGLLCLQVGRIDNGRLGVLGQDGAFGNDGRFHPVAADVVGYHLGTAELSTCLTPGQTASLEAAIPQNGVFGMRQPVVPVPVSERRWISYGLLGPHAVSITYAVGGQQRTMPVERSTGAYLLVLVNPPKGDFETGGGGYGSNTYGPGPQGALTSITYRIHGLLCHESLPTNKPMSPCPRPATQRPPHPPRRLRRPISVRVEADGAATVTFRAPHTVSSAASGYTLAIPSPCHAGISVTPLERDVRAGQLVHMHVQNLFANVCGPMLTVRVIYDSQGRQPLTLEGEEIVGEATITTRGRLVR